MEAKSSSAVLFGAARAPRWVRRTAWAAVCAAGAAEVVGMVHLLLYR